MSLLTLTWRYLTFHKVKSLLLLLALTLTFFLPIAAAMLVSFYEDEMSARADATPLVIGARGDRFDLVLKSLYFTGDAPPEISHLHYEDLQKSGRALAIPLNLEFTARGKPIVGCSPEYYAFRSLRAAAGRLPALAGEVALGANAAADLKLEVGGTLPSDQVNLYDLAAAYPLRMKVVGILNAMNNADDRAVFTTLESAWVIGGHGHGHQKLDESSAADQLLGRGEKSVTASAAVEQFIEITPENISGFHFHEDRSALPLSALIAVPNSPKDSTLLKGKFSVAEDLQLLTPPDVIAELMGVVFRIKRFFDTSFILVVLAAISFLALIVLLSLRLRKKERETLARMGCGRSTIAFMQTAEIVIIALAALILALAASLLLLKFGPNLLLR